MKTLKWDSVWVVTFVDDRPLVYSSAAENMRWSNMTDLNIFIDLGPKKIERGEKVCDAIVTMKNLTNEKKMKNHSWFKAEAEKDK